MRNFLRWTREISGMAISENSDSRGHILAPGESKTIIDNSVVTLSSLTGSWAVIAGNAIQYTGSGLDLSAVQAGQFLLFNGKAYAILSKTVDSILFSSAASIAPGAISGQILVYSAALSLIYVESSQNSTVTMNNNLSAKIEPFNSSNGSSTPGMLLNKSTVYKLVVTNDGIEPATIYFAGVE